MSRRDRGECDGTITLPRPVKGRQEPSVVRLNGTAEPHVGDDALGVPSLVLTFLFRYKSIAGQARNDNVCTVP